MGNSWILTWRPTGCANGSFNPWFRAEIGMGTLKCLFQTWFFLCQKWASRTEHHSNKAPSPKGLHLLKFTPSATKSSPCSETHRWERRVGCSQHRHWPRGTNIPQHRTPPCPWGWGSPVGPLHRHPAHKQGLHTGKCCNQNHQENMQWNFWIKITLKTNNTCSDRGEAFLLLI